MWGAIIGDLAGSIYEYGEFCRLTCKKEERKNIILNELITEESFFSDDTILTMAILEAILHNNDYVKYLKNYGKSYENYKPNFVPYFKTSFSPGYMKWINDEKKGNSTGNGAMMRISPVGYLFDNVIDVKKNTYDATKPSHNTEEAMYCTYIISLIIYYARLGLSKSQIYDKIHIMINIKLTPFEKFNTSCYETISNCLYVLFNTNNFEESIKSVISLGGDTDTNATIVGSMAEALYGIDNNLIRKAKEKIPKEFCLILEKGYKKIKKLS